MPNSTEHLYFISAPTADRQAVSEALNRDDTTLRGIAQWRDDGSVVITVRAILEQAELRSYFSVPDSERFFVDDWTDAHYEVSRGLGPKEQGPSVMDLYWPLAVRRSAEGTE